MCIRDSRYLIVPGIGSSRIHILDTKADPKHPKIVKVIEPEEFIRKTGYTSPHTIHCGPDGIYGSALGSASGDGPGGIFLMDADTFELKGPWEKEHGPQNLAYDFWWHLGHDTLISSEWGTPNMVKNGLNAELLLGGKYGRRLHIWDLDKRRHLQEIDLGAEQQMVLELRPAPVSYTHLSHWDHVGGHKYFRTLNPRVRFYARSNYQDEIARDVDQPGKFDQQFFGKRFSLDDVRSFKPDVTIDRRTDLKIGRTRIELIPVHGGETHDAMFIYLPDQDVMFVGDFIMPYPVSYTHLDVYKRQQN